MPNYYHDVNIYYVPRPVISFKAHIRLREVKRLAQDHTATSKWESGYTSMYFSSVAQGHYDTLPLIIKIR